MIGEARIVINDPPYLQKTDRFIFPDADDQKLPSTGTFKVKFCEGNAKVNNTYDDVSDFCCLKNKYKSLIEYEEMNMITPLTYGMPSILEYKGRNDVRQENNIYYSYLKPRESKCLWVGCLKDGVCVLTKITHCFTSGHIVPKVSSQVTFLKQEQKKIKRLQAKYESFSLKNWRILHIHEEHKKWELFFKEFSGFQPNDVIIMLFTLSCFPVHSPPIVRILNRISRFFGFVLYWSNSVNYTAGRCSFNTPHIVSAFEMRFLKIVDTFCKQDEDVYDKCLASYFKRSKCISKAKLWVIVKKHIIPKLHELEITLDGDCEKIRSEFRAFFEDFFSLKYPLSTLDFEIDMCIEDDNETEGEIELQQSSVFQFLKRRRSVRAVNKKKKTKKCTRDKEIKYSNVFFMESPHVIHIHPIIMKNFADPKRIFMGFRKKPNTLKRNRKKKIKR